MAAAPHGYVAASSTQHSTAGYGTHTLEVPSFGVTSFHFLVGFLVTLTQMLTPDQELS